MREEKIVYQSQSVPSSSNVLAAYSETHLMNEGRGSLRVYPASISQALRVSSLDCHTKVDDQGKVATA